MQNKTEDQITAEVVSVLDLQNQVSTIHSELMKNSKFVKFIELQKEFNEKSSKVWKDIEATMIENNIKSIKGDWGSLGITKRTDYKVDEDLLPPKFYKKVVDNSKIKAAHALEGKLPKGVSTVTKEFLTKRLK